MAERTLVLIKPDAVLRGLAGEILSRFERRGLMMRAAKLVLVDQALASEHYAVRTFTSPHAREATRGRL